jgi:ribosomal protein L12E/L44/L45/RPP1/RPP2
MGTVVDKGRDFHGVLQNVSITTAGHFDIDKNQALQDKVIAEIRAAASGRPARVATAPATRAAAAPGTRAAAVDTSANHAFSQDRR